MKILVTGGAGFIGSHIADRYLQEGHEVVIFDDLSSGQEKNIPHGARFYKISITTQEAQDLLKQERPDVLNHHAAQINVRSSVEDPSWDAKINIMGSLNLLESCRKNNVRKIIFASSGGAIYGNQTVFPADEAHQVEPLSPYGISKLTIEKYLRFYQNVHGIDFVALRYGNVYGPRQNALGEAGVIAIFTSGLLKNQPTIIYGSGNQTRDYVFIDDVVRCNVNALKKDVQGVFNVGTGVETDVNQLARNLSQIIGTDQVPKHAPARSGEVARSCLKTGALQKERPVLLEEGLRKTVAWFRENL